MKFVNVLHWNGYESGYQGGQASMVLPMIGLSVGTAIMGACVALLINAAVKKENPNSKEKSQRYQRKANQRD